MATELERVHVARQIIQYIQPSLCWLSMTMGEGMKLWPFT